MGLRHQFSKWRYEKMHEIQTTYHRYQPFVEVGGDASE
jgi:hypothetical protein